MSGQLSEATSKTAKIDIQGNTGVVSGVAKGFNNFQEGTREYLKIEYKDGQTSSRIYMKGEEKQSKEVAFVVEKIESGKDENKENVLYQKVTTVSIFDSNGKPVSGFKVTITKLQNSVLHRYSCALQIAQSDKYKNLSTFPSHNLCHIKAVCERSSQVADIISGGNAVVKAYTRLASEVHDTGMAGLPKTGAVIAPDGSGTLKEFSNDKQIRQEHSVNSGVEVLRNANSYKEMGLHPGMVALAAASHSKSNSGINDMNNIGQWAGLVAKIEQTCLSIESKMNTAEVKEMYVGIADMKSMFVCYNNGEYGIAKGREGDFETMKMSAIGVTIGDALSHTYGTGEGFEAQNGNFFEFSNIPHMDNIEDLKAVLNDIDDSISDGDISSLPCTEIKGIQQDFVTSEGDIVRTDIMDGISDVSAAYCLGENNIEYLPPQEIEGGGVRLEAHIKDITVCPVSTIVNGLSERVFEGVRLNIPVEFVTKIDNTNINKETKEYLEMRIGDVLAGNLENYVEEKYSQQNVSERLLNNITIK